MLHFNLERAQYKTTKVAGFRWFCSEKHSKLKDSGRHTTGYAQILAAKNVSVDYFDANKKTTVFPQWLLFTTIF